MRFPPQSRILPHREGGFSARWRGLGRCWGRRRGAGAVARAGRGRRQGWGATRSTSPAPCPTARARQAAAARSHTGPPAIQGITRPSQAPPNRYKHHQTIDSSAPRNAFNTPAPPTTAQRRPQRPHHAEIGADKASPSSPCAPGGGREKPHRTSRHPGHHPAIPSTAQPLRAPPDHRQQRSPRCLQHPNAAHNGPPTPTTTHRRSQRPHHAEIESDKAPPQHAGSARRRPREATPDLPPSRASPGHPKHRPTLTSTTRPSTAALPAMPSTPQHRPQRPHDAHNEPTMPRSTQTRHPPAAQARAAAVSSADSEPPRILSSPSAPDGGPGAPGSGPDARGGDVTGQASSPGTPDGSPSAPNSSG